jgi:hypothetical protein
MKVVMQAMQQEGNRCRLGRMDVQKSGGCMSTMEVQRAKKEAASQ